MSRVNGLFQDKQTQTLKDRHFRYCEHLEEGETPMSLSDYAADLADELKERSKYE